MTNGFIFIAGDFSFDRLGASYKRAFEANGQRVDIFDLAEAAAQLDWPGRNRILHRITIKSISARRIWSKKLNQEFLLAAHRSSSSWVLVLNGEWIMPETFKELKQSGKRVAIFHADNPLPPHYNNRPETMLAALEADIYFVWSELLVQKMRTMGVKRVEFLPFGWDPVVFPFQSAIPQGSWPGALFIGGWDREREEFLDELAAHLPLRIYGPDYWGTRTRSKGRSRASWQGGAIRDADAARVIRQSALCLNILRTQHMVDYKTCGVIQRHFEVPGAGGFLLSTRTDEALRLFPEGESGTYFGDVSECIYACKFFLHDSGARYKVQTSSQIQVAKNHLYIHRAREMYSFLSSHREDHANHVK